jgi:DNA-binding transcriptional regulator YhcF (GntR family)
MLSIDRSSPIALVSQIETRLRALVENRALPTGAKLMSICQLATHLAVSTKTVVVAYDRLVSSDFVLVHGQ